MYVCVHQSLQLQLMTPTSTSAAPAASLTQLIRVNNPQKVNIKGFTYIIIRGNGLLRVTTLGGHCSYVLEYWYSNIIVVYLVQACSLIFTFLTNVLC